jgi:hypothetical protein
MLSHLTCILLAYANMLSMYICLYQYIYDLKFIISKMYIKCYSFIELFELTPHYIFFRFLVSISMLTLSRVTAFLLLIGMPCLLSQGFSYIFHSIS